MAARKNRATSAPAHGSTSDLGSTSAKKSGFMTRLIFVVAAIVLILCLAALALFGLQYCVQQKAYDDLESYADTSTLNLADLKVDWEGLSAINPDICAWIYIPDTKVSYPVLRKQDAENPYDDYYLSHTAEGQNGLPGSIYVEPCNAGDFSDNNTVVYGHHMKNGTMFGSLHEYQDESYMEKHPYVYVITPERERVYQVFAAIAYDDRHLMGSFASFTEPEEREAFLSSLKENGDETDVIREDIAVTADSKLLTLSTCIKNQSEKRLLVEAVQVYESET